MILNEIKLNVTRSIYVKLKEFPVNEPHSQKISLEVEEELIEAHPRLDKYIDSAIPDLSRSRIKSLIEESRILVNGEKASPAHRVKAGEEITIEVPEAQEAIPQAESIPLNVVYEDSDLLVIDKPPGMVVHQGAGNYSGTLVNALLYHCGDSLSGIGGVKRPGIVHRLDKGTSGLMVVAKNDLAHQGLASQFEDRSLSRTYHAIIWGAPTPHQGVIEGYIRRDPKARQRMQVHAHTGKYAKTHYQLLERLGRHASLLECHLETGRTHQIRVHLSSLLSGVYRHGLVLDPVYGKRPRVISPQMASGLNVITDDGEKLLLHAHALKFSHPRSGEDLRFTSPTPAYMIEAMDYLRTLI